MSLAPDSIRLTQIIIGNLDLFPNAKSALAAPICKIAMDAIKNKATDFSAIKRLLENVGSRDFALLLDGVTGPTLSKIVKAGGDGDNPEIRGATPAWLRSRLIHLAEGGAPYIKPAAVPRPRTARVSKPKAEKVAKTPAPKKETNPTKAKNSKVVWDGKNRDDEV